MILIISPQKRFAKSLESLLRLRGLITKRCTPIEAMHFNSAFLSAILLLCPEDLISQEEFIGMLTSVNSSTPIFAITKAEDKLKLREAYADVIAFQEISGKILDRIHLYQKQHGHRLSGFYHLWGLDASISNQSVTFKNAPIPLTKTEKTILRYLICRYPAECDALEIAFTIYPPGHTPGPSCVRAHICAINRKFKSQHHSPLIISNRCEGYIIHNDALLEE